MKKLMITLSLVVFSLATAAQETSSDSIRLPEANYKQFGDFILDVSLRPIPKLPKINLLDMLGPDMSKDYTLIFQLDPKWSVTMGYAQSVFNSYGYFSGTHQMQEGTFRLNGNMRLNTFGQYTLDGRRLPNTGVHPWEKNNFMGGMELKFNKNFGIRIEVRQGTNPGYPY